MSLRPPDAERIIGHVLDCDEALALLVAGRAHYRSHPPRSTIAAAGSVSELIMLIVAGHARMLAFSIDGRLVVVRDLLAGDLFGEGGLRGDRIVADDVVAVDTVETGAFEAHVFIALMTSHACIALAVSRLLVARLTATTQRLVEGATLTAVGRIHAELLRQARAAEAMTIRPAPVLSVLALAVQSTRETVSRTISALEKRGIIARDAESLRVVAPHRLEDLIC